jgi:hypothetical protein
MRPIVQFREQGAVHAGATHRERSASHLREQRDESGRRLSLGGGPAADLPAVEVFPRVEEKLRA